MGEPGPEKRLGLSRTALFPDLARRKNPLQTDSSWRLVGSPAAAVDDDRLLVVVWKRRLDLIRWTCLSTIRLRRSSSLDMLFKCGVEQWKQPWWKLSLSNQSICSTSNYSRRFSRREPC